jgi:pectinesterase
LRGSGIDVWAKRVAYPIIDRWYAKGHDQFHQDEEGEGLDLYSIGGSRGAGGTGIWDGSKLWTSDNFTQASVLANGPRHAAFVLTYAPWEAGAAGEVGETKRFRVDCGRNFDEVWSTFAFKGSEAIAGIGITQHPPVAGFPAAVLTRDPDGRWMSYWEENKDGGLGVAVLLGNSVESEGFAHEAAPGGKGNANNLLLVKVKPGVPVHYFTGAGWTKSGQFADRASWENHVRDNAVRLRHPPQVTVSARP